MITSTGLGSGININSLVTQLVEAERAPSTARFDRQEATIRTKITSFGNLKSALSTFRDSLSGLKNISAFQKMNATSSDTTRLSVSAASNADSGTYQVEVKQLAQNHALASGAYADLNTKIGTGTLTIKLGTTTYDAGTDTYGGFTENDAGSTLTIAVDSTNNTLTGLRDAINEANGGVTAAIVNDGTGNRLVLASRDSGAKNSLQISVTGDGDGNDTDAAGLSALTFDTNATHLTQTQTAQDAELSINGLAITSASNAVTSALKGVTLNLLQADVGRKINVSINPNSADVKSAIEGFVKNYNELVSFVSSVASYDATEKVAGPLLGDATLRGVMNSLRTTLAGSVNGRSQTVFSLSDIGIELKKDGTLNLNASKLDEVLAKDLSAVADLFAVTGRPTNSNVVFLNGSSATKSGDYVVHLTQAAQAGVFRGGAVSGLTIDADNESLRVKVDGTFSGSIKLTQGTYASQAELATEIEKRINADTALAAAGAKVEVSYDTANNRFEIKSNKLGGKSAVEITSVDTTSQATLGLSVGAGTVGRDVAGIIAKRSETAGTLLGGAITDSTIGADNDTLQVKVDGVESGQIVLTQGAYSNRDLLAAELEKQINADAALKTGGAAVDVSYDAEENQFVVQSKRTGATSAVEILSVDTGTEASLGLRAATGSPRMVGNVAGAVVGSAASSLTIDANNDTLQLKVDGVASGVITLTQKGYDDQEQLAAEIEAKINADSALKSASRSVSVTYDEENRRFSIQSSKLGYQSSVEITATDASTATSLGLKVGLGTLRQVGSSTGSGIAASGSGEELTSLEGDANGLKLLVSGSDTGYQGEVTFTRGLIQQMDKVLGDALGLGGSLGSRLTGLQSSLTDIGTKRTRLQTRLSNMERLLFQKFNAMDRLVGQLQSTSTYLSQQLGNLPYSGSQNSNR